MVRQSFDKHLQNRFNIATLQYRLVKKIPSSQENERGRHPRQVNGINYWAEVIGQTRLDTIEQVEAT